ncbi:Hsp70 family protein [Streptomyces sp. NPDC059744]|uniref:Hsp70 family protein n=1 Tax=Streptomyces sp. NPDC059744 TaxID=3346929 RepID=UPI0036600B2C
MERNARRPRSRSFDAHVNEPTVPALAFGLDKKQHGTGLVTGLGGGTFDVGDGVVDLRSMAGDSRLCGDGFDRRLVGHPAEQVSAGERHQLAQGPARAAVAEAAERAKTELNAVTQTNSPASSSTSRSTSPALAQRFQVVAVPTPVMLDMGAEMSRRTGAAPSRRGATVEGTIAGRG